MSTARWLVLLTVVWAGCAGDDGPEAAGGGRGGGSHGVTQGGPQDIGRFRQILEEGEIPSPRTLDVVGYFNEHALDLPPADCGEDVCLHAMLAIAPRFDQSNWSMAYVAMNTPIDPAALPRPPMHVVVAMERTARTAEAWVAIVDGVRRLAAELQPDDRLSLVAFSEQARVLANGLDPADAPGLEGALADAGAVPQGARAALYDAMATGAQLLEDTGGASRLVVVTSGLADGGVADEAHVQLLGEQIVQGGTGLTIVGAGEPFDPRLPIALSSLAAGAYYHPADAADTSEVFALEATTTLFPIAQDFTLRLTPAPGYRVGRVYGVKRFATQGGLAVLATPALFVGHREGSDDVAAGRRGGGGALFVELVPEDGAQETISAGQAAFRVDASWTDPLTHETHGANAAVTNPFTPGFTPDAAHPYFSDDGRSKAYWMLNTFLALRASVDFQETGDCARAKGVLDMMQPMVEQWLLTDEDPDIRADLDLMIDLHFALEQACQATVPIRPLVFDGGCFSS